MLTELIDLLSNPIPQDPSYHLFCDNREFWGIANFMDVTSNIAFIIFGVLGFTWAKGTGYSDIKEPALPRTAWQIFFIGAILTGIGSGYYHLAPTNETLVWDRLPMTIAFMSVISAMISERLHWTFGKASLPLLLILGAASVFYWHYTEQLGIGDLRPYALVQFGSLFFLLGLVLATRKKYQGNKFLFYALTFYLLAKFGEHFDCQIYDLTDSFISGHSLKHLSAAISIYYAGKYVLFMHKRTS